MPEPRPQKVQRLNISTGPLNRIIRTHININPRRKKAGLLTIKSRLEKHILS